MKKITILLGAICASYMSSSCGETKMIAANKYMFKYTDNQAARPANDKLEVYKVKKWFKAKLEDKTDFLIVKPIVAPVLNTDMTLDNTYEVTPPDAKKIAISGKYYTSESDLNGFKNVAGVVFDLDSYQGSFVYYDAKFALQSLTVPIKYRGAAGVQPSTVETGFSVGISPVIKWNKNVFNPIKKTMGKPTNIYSVNTGLLFNFGATELKGATTAPGITPDRKSGTFSYGGVITIGVNNLHLGYAVGADRILGTGSSKWIYQDKIWHGFILGLDIIK